MARDLDRDPERLSIQCLPLIAYAKAKATFDQAKDKKQLDAWEGDAMMEAVERNTIDLHKERVIRWRAEKDAKEAEAKK